MLQQSDFQTIKVKKGDIIKIKDIAWYKRNLIKGFQSIPNFYQESNLIVTSAYLPILSHEFKIVGLDREHKDGCVIDWDGDLVTIPTWAIVKIG